MTAPNPLYVVTPMVESFPLSKHAGRRVFLKLDNLQPSGSFKMRGISALCQSIINNGGKHIISSSGGNAGYTAAYVANQLGVKATVFVPTSTGENVVMKLREVNAEVRKHGRFWQEAHDAAIEFQHSEGGDLIHPFDNPIIWEGHSSLIREAAQQMSRPDAILLTVGGGGLLSGVALGLTAAGWNDVPIIAIETLGADSLAQAMAAGKPVRLKEITSIAKTLGANQVCDQAFRVTREYAVRSVVVTDEAAVSACRSFANDHRFIVEPACGAALSLVYSNHEAIGKFKSILVIVCGGIGFTANDLVQD
jgi:L-serine/L-threonine ammonia-lyase